MSERPRFVVALVRHGDYEQPDRVPSALLPHPLTAKGREQAHELAATLLAEARAHALTLATALDCSPLLRAWQTATLTAERLRESSGRAFEVAEHEALCERSLGAAANLTIEQIADAVASDPRLSPLPPDWKSHPRHRLPFLGAESLMQAGARVAAHLESRAHAHAARSSEDLLQVIVSHGGALRHAAVTLGALEIERAAGLSLRHCGHVLVERHADGHWTQIGGSWKVRAASSGGD
ncbi:histidine phosphatase family protein [Nannocystaceae bacterium ST9]